MRNHKVVIREAQLLASSPQTVVAFLEQRADLPRGKRRDENFDEEFEAALLGRNDPLINLALAQYAQYSATLRPLFEASPPGSAVRLAILSNVILPDGFFSQLPLSLMQGPENVITWLRTAPDIETRALFENPYIYDGFIQSLLEGKAPWNTIPEDKLCFFVRVLAENPRMCMPYDKSFLDGYAEYSHSAVFNAAWHLAEKVPTTQGWAIALSSLYQRLKPEAFKLDNPLEIAGRWIADPNDAELMGQQESFKNTGYLHLYQEVRQGLAHLALTYKGDLLQTLLSHDDVAFRCAAYAHGQVTADMLPGIYERDGELAFNQACRNPWLWRRQQEREALRAMAWQVSHDDKNSDLIAVNSFNAVSEDFAKKHPDWFKNDEEYVSESTDETAIKADTAALSETLDDQRSTQTEQILRNLKKLESRIGWIFWFSLGAVVMGLKHF